MGCQELFIRKTNCVILFACICLAGQVTVSGWGKLTEGDQSGPDTLQKVSLPLLSKSECQKILKRRVTNKMLCAGSPGKDACYG